ncbi:MAG: hypothetical protein ACQGVC_00210 [Myxococcota bacterium]
MSEGMSGRQFGILLLLVTLLALGLRLYRLGDPSLWSDEMFQARDSLVVANAGYLPTRWGMALAGAPLASLDPQRLADWRAAGVAPADMRLGSALVGALSVPLLALACAPWLTRRTALVFALLLATSTWHLEWSQQARHYTAIFLYSNLALALYALYLKQGALRWLALGLGLAFVAVTARATSLMVFGVIGLDVAVETLRRRRIALAPSALAAVAVCVAASLAVLFLRSLGSGAGGSGEQAAFLARKLGSSSFRVFAGNALLSGIPLVVLAAAGFVAHRRRAPREALLLAFVVAVPLLAFGALASFAHVEVRYTFVNHFGWLVLAALGAVALWDAVRPTLPALAAASPLLVVLASHAYAGLVYYESAYGNRPRWNHAFAYVGAHWKPGDALYAHSSWAGEYYLGSDRVRNVDLDFEGIDTLTGDTWFVVKSTAAEHGAGRDHWLDAAARLRAVYPMRTAYPQDTVRVYHYEHAP